MGRIGGSCVLLGSHKILGLVTGGSYVLLDVHSEESLFVLLRLGRILFVDRVG